MIINNFTKEDVANLKALISEKTNGVEVELGLMNSPIHPRFGAAYTRQALPNHEKSFLQQIADEIIIECGQSITSYRLALYTYVLNPAMVRYAKCRIDH